MKTFDEWCQDREIVLNELSPKLLAMAYKIWGEECFVEGQRYEAVNAAMRKQISEMIMPPCTLGDKLYIVSFYFGDGYDEAGKATHTSGWQITETKVDEKNFYKMCDLVRNGKAFFSREAAEARLAELKGEER